MCHRKNNYIKNNNKILPVFVNDYCWAFNDMSTEEFCQHEHTGIMVSIIKETLDLLQAKQEEKTEKLAQLSKLKFCFNGLT